MNVLTDIPFTLDTDQLMEYMRIDPGTERAEEFRDVINEVKNVGKPKVLYKVSFIDSKGEDTVTLDGVTFTSVVLRKNLDSIERVFPYVATCGTEIDNISVEQGDFEKKIWLSIIKGKLLDAAMQYLMEHVSGHYKLSKISSMNPGSGDASVWPIKQQGVLYSICGDVEGLIGVKLTKTMMLMPEMSLAGILFPSEIEFESCQLCLREKCPTRRAPFDKDLWESMNPQPGLV